MTCRITDSLWRFQEDITRVRPANGKHELFKVEWAFATLHSHGDVAEKDEVTKI